MIDMRPRSIEPAGRALAGAAEPAPERAGGLMLVRRAWGGGFGPEGVERVSAHGAHFVDVAIELWRLAGWPERGHQIEAIVERILEQEGNLASARSIAELLDLIAGLDEALRDSVTDAQLRVAPGALPVLRAHTSLLELVDRPGHAATDAIVLAVAQTRELQAVLEDALARGLGARFG